GGCNRKQEGIDLLQEALQEFQEASGGVLPTTANGAVSTLVTFHEDVGHYERGEKVLFAQLKRPAQQQQTYGLTQRLYQLYHRALDIGRETSLGAGQTLYQVVERKLRADLDTPDHNHRYALLNQLVAVYRTAHRKKVPGVTDDLKAFAFKRFPDVLKQQTNRYDEIVGSVGHAVHD